MTELPDCARCGHPASWHRLNDALDVGPVDPRARFRCLSHDPEADTLDLPDDRHTCTCPDYIGPAQVPAP